MATCASPKIARAVHAYRPADRPGTGGTITRYRLPSNVRQSRHLRRGLRGPEYATTRPSRMSAERPMLHDGVSRPIVVRTC
jgi:hypothetical protein